jgi:hypothetical protein
VIWSSIGRDMAACAEPGTDGGPHTCAVRGCGCGCGCGYCGCVAVWLGGSGCDGVQNELGMG